VHGSPSNLFKIHFNIIVPYTPTASKWYISLRSPTRSLVCTSPVYTCSTHLILLDSITDNLIKFLVIENTIFSCKRMCTASTITVIWFRQSACTSTIMHRFRVHCLFLPPPKKQQLT
jgi:hypothetical protein